MHDPLTCPGCAQPDLAFAPHDHSRCADDVLALAETQLAQGGQRLTPVRRRTLQILLEAHRAMGAYDVLERLAAEGFGHQPPVAYRAPRPSSAATLASSAADRGAAAAGAPPDGRR